MKLKSNLVFPDGTTQTTASSGGASLPAGMLAPYAGTTAPSGWLLCDGSAISRTTYATLFTAIGTTYGAGNGSTTFNIPDTRGRMPIGAGTGAGLTARTLGATGGVESVTLTSAQSGLVGHNHTGTSDNQNVDHTHTWGNWSGGISANHTHDASHAHSVNQTTSASSGAHNNTGGYVAAGTNGAATSTNNAVNAAYFGTGTVSADHAHYTSGTTSGMSTNHTHTFTTASVASANASASHDNMSPWLAFNYIIKT